jgi:hypothetical protein
MIDQVETVPRTGRRVQWDATNPGELREVAGDRFTGLWEQLAVVVNNDGIPVYMRPGWSVICWDDNGELSIVAGVRGEYRVVP